MKITKEMARQFLYNQKNIGDRTAIEEMHGMARDYELQRFLTAMENLNECIIGMENGSFDYDAEIDKYYRNGMCLLAIKCKEIIWRN